MCVALMGDACFLNPSHIVLSRLNTVPFLEVILPLGCHLTVFFQSAMLFDRLEIYSNWEIFSDLDNGQHLRAGYGVMPYLQGKGFIHWLLGKGLGDRSLLGLRPFTKSSFLSILLQVKLGGDGGW